MNFKKMPGPGDEATWSRYSGHPLDPRAPDEYEPSYEEISKLASMKMLDDADLFIEFLNNLEEESKFDVFYKSLEFAVRRRSTDSAVLDRIKRDFADFCIESFGEDDLVEEIREIKDSDEDIYEVFA